MSNILHTFVSGLRFQTEVQYRVKGTHGPLWQKLPTTPPRMAHTASPRHKAALCITQCLALQGQLQRATAMTLFRRLSRISDLDAMESAGVKQLIDTLGLSVPLQVFPADSPAVCGSLVQDALETGGVGMLRCVSSQGMCWWGGSHGSGRMPPRNAAARQGP